MTESEWLACDDPEPMLAFLRGEAVTLLDRVPPEQHEAMRQHLLTATSRHKRALFACACCRPLWPLLKDERSRNAIAVAEQFLDGLADDRQLWAARAAALDARDASRPHTRGPGREAGQVARAAAVAAWKAVSFEAAEAAAECATAAVWAALFPSKAEAKREQVRLLHDIIGNPFRPSPHLPASLLDQADGLIPKLAQAAYDNRELPSGHLEPSRLAVLADALEEAGVADADLLQQLRGPGPHVRGCHVLDLVLGRG